MLVIDFSPDRGSIILLFFENIIRTGSEWKELLLTQEHSLPAEVGSSSNVTLRQTITPSNDEDYIKGSCC